MVKLRRSYRPGTKPGSLGVPFGAALGSLPSSPLATPTVVATPRDKRTGTRIHSVSSGPAGARAVPACVSPLADLAFEKSFNGGSYRVLGGTRQPLATLFRSTWSDYLGPKTPRRYLAPLGCLAVSCFSIAPGGTAEIATRALKQMSVLFFQCPA